MKRIFLIGDSIRIGYDQYVRELMVDTAQLYWPDDNARFVGYTLRYLHEWAGHDCDPKSIDVVHWNNGLWDALHVLGEDAQTPRAGIRRDASAHRAPAEEGVPECEDRLCADHVRHRGAHESALLSQKRRNRAL